MGAYPNLSLLRHSPSTQGHQWSLLTFHSYSLIIVDNLLCEAFLVCLSVWLVSRLDLDWQIWCQASKCITEISVLLALPPLGCGKLNQMWFHIYFMPLRGSMFLFHRSYKFQQFALGSMHITHPLCEPRTGLLPLCLSGLCENHSSGMLLIIYYF